MGPEAERSLGTDEIDLPQRGNDQVYTFSCILPCSASPDDQASVHEQVNRIFSKGLSFYPELEWKSRYPPPQGHEILGAWRDGLNRAFVFLLSNPGMKPAPGTAPLLVHCVGARAVLNAFRPQVERLSNDLTTRNLRQRSGKKLQGRLKEADTSKALKRLMMLLGAITGVVNALSIYLRRLPPPTIEVAWLLKTYNVLLPCVHIGALMLFLLFIALLALFSAKMGYLLIKKL